MKRFWSASVLGAVILSGCSPEPEPSVSVELALSTSTPVIRTGERPNFSVRLINRGTEEVTIVLPGDGSELGWRTPMVHWSPERMAGGRCGNINALRAEEIVTLRPREERELGEWIGAPNLAAAGSYDVFVTYENDPKLEWRGIPLGEHDVAAMARVRSSTPIRATSNKVAVVVDR